MGSCTAHKEVYQEVKQRYPHCSILKIDQDENMYKVKIQCGNAPPRTLKLKSR